MTNDYINLLGRKLVDLIDEQPLIHMAQDSVTELIGSDFYMMIEKHGLSLVASFDNLVTSIHFYSGRVGSDAMFAGSLPDNLLFSNSREFVLSKLGKPALSNSHDLSSYLGDILPWDRYDRNGYVLHIEYTNDCSAINLVTLMTPDAAPK